MGLEKGGGGGRRNRYGRWGRREEENEVIDQIDWPGCSWVFKATLKKGLKLYRL